MTDLMQHSPVDSSLLDRDEYFLSLMMACSQAMLLSEERQAAIQQQIMQRLSEFILKYTGGRSSSVRTETAESILQSILYCCGLYLLSLPVPQAVELLLSEEIAVLHDRGLELGRSYWVEAQATLQRVKLTRLRVHHLAYQDSITDGLATFFNSYRIEYAARETEAMIDYPLLCEVRGEGIQYIQRYLNGLLLENQFCAHFDVQEIRELLRLHGIRYKMPAEEVMTNITELVLINAMAARLLGKPARLLVLSPEDRNVLCEQPEGQDIRSAFARLLDRLNIPSEQRSYLLGFREELATRWAAAEETHTLDQMILA